MHYGPRDGDDIRIGPGLGGTVAAARERRGRWPYFAAAVVVLVAGCGTGAWWLTRDTTPLAPATLTIDGQLVMSSIGSGNDVEGALCVPYGDGYADIRPGTQVTVTDEAAKVVGLGQLGSGLTGPAFKCLIPFNIPNIPAGHPFYGVEVAHRGVVRFTPAQISAGQVKLTLGN